MDISALSGSGVGLLQQLLSTLQAGRTSQTGQTSPGDKTDPASFAGPPPGAPPGPPPQKPAGSASDRFGSDTLATLISAQEAPQGSDLVNKLISSLDTNGDGQVSLDEIQSALSKKDDASSTAGTAQQPDRSAAFGQIDTSGDGKLSADELLSALSAMHKHHHGHHGPQSAAAANSNASAATPTTTETATAAVTANATTPQNAAA